MLCASGGPFAARYRFCLGRGSLVRDDSRGPGDRRSNQSNPNADAHKICPRSLRIVFADITAHLYPSAIDFHVRRVLVFVGVRFRLEPLPGVLARGAKHQRPRPDRVFPAEGATRFMQGSGTSRKHEVDRQAEANRRLREAEVLAAVPLGVRLVRLGKPRVLADELAPFDVPGSGHVHADVSQVPLHGMTELQVVVSLREELEVERDRLGDFRPEVPRSDVVEGERA